MLIQMRSIGGAGSSVQAANRLTHIRLSSSAQKGGIHIWTGARLTTDYEDAEFSITFSWSRDWEPNEYYRYYRDHIFHLSTLCDLLGAKTARMLVLDLPPQP